MAPQPVRDWVLSLSAWVDVSGEVERGVDTPPGLSAADQQAISLARDLQGLLLMDERVGRRYAHSLGLKTIGTLGLLELAGEHSLIDFPASLTMLPRPICRKSEWNALWRGIGRAKGTENDHAPNGAGAIKARCARRVARSRHPHRCPGAGAGCRECRRRAVAAGNPARRTTPAPHPHNPRWG
jgi:hypothetical protein